MLTARPIFMHWIVRIWSGGWWNGTVHREYGLQQFRSENWENIAVELEVFPFLYVFRQYCVLPLSQLELQYGSVVVPSSIAAAAEKWFEEWEIELPFAFLYLDARRGGWVNVKKYEINDTAMCDCLFGCLLELWTVASRTDAAAASAMHAGKVSPCKNGLFRWVPEVYWWCHSHWNFVLRSGVHSSMLSW